MTEPLLKCDNLSKRFGITQAAKDISLEVMPNEVVGIIGENGAGKSTLLRMMIGLDSPDTGTMTLRGEPYSPSDPRHAAKHGVGMVFQEQSLLSNLSVAQNMFLGNERRFMRFGAVSKKRMHLEAREYLARLDGSIDPAMNTGALDFPRRQLVELAKVLTLDTQTDSLPLLILLDEPTTVLSGDEIERLFDLIRSLRDRASFIFISHRIEEVLELSDRAYILRDGANVSTLRAEDASEEEIHKQMVGRTLRAEYYRQGDQIEPETDPILELQGLTDESSFRDIDLTVRRGEIVGICGVEGSGKEGLCRTLAGSSLPQSGSLLYRGKQVFWSSPSEAVAAGVGYLPKERVREGIIARFDIASNLTLARIGLAERLGLLDRKVERQLADEWITKLRIKASGPRTPLTQLSGGNQQKVVLAKWLASGVDLLVLEHPTRGIDIGAKEEIYEFLRSLAASGVAILLSSDTLEEVIGLSNTIVAMKDGEIQAVIPAPPDAKPTQEEVAIHLV